MNIYAFYEPIDENWVNKTDQKILIDLWKKSWARYGWNPVIITLDDAKEHPLYYEFYKKVESFPTVCPKIYDMYCFLRWLSFAKYGGWMSAVSVMNYGFVPADFEDQVVTSHAHPFLVPTAAIHIPKRKINVIIDTIMNYTINENDVIPVAGIDKPHISDMIILNRTLGPLKFIDVKLDVASSYKPDQNWQNSPIVHYPVLTPYMYGEKDKHKTRTQVILEDKRWKNIL